MIIIIACMCGVWATIATVWGFRERGKKIKVERAFIIECARPLTCQELATQKRVSKSTIARLAREGKIKAEKVGRQWRISQGGE